MSDCIVICETQLEAEHLRRHLAPRFARVEPVWSFRQLILGDSVGADTLQASRTRNGAAFGNADTVLFCGFPALADGLSWNAMSADQQFAQQEYASALSGVLLGAPARLVNRGLLRRGLGTGAHPALFQRLMGGVGWSLAESAVRWANDEGFAYRYDTVTAVYRLWITPLNHHYEDYIDLKFPDDWRIDGLIRDTQDFLLREEFACCQLELVTDGQSLRLAQASLGQLPSDLPDWTAEFLLAGVVG